MGLITWLARLVNPPDFIVSLHDGHATAERGNLSVAFLTECAQLARKRGIRGGRIYGVRKRGVLSLEFSPEISPDDHQVIRNIWGLHRRRHK